jgi:hypothetical protein
MTDGSPDTLHEFAETVVRRLAAAQAEDGRLRDPIDGTRIDPREYAQTAFTTAAGRLADRTGEDSLLAAALSALDLFFETDLPAGHADEFSTFALQELLASDVELSADRRRRIVGFAAYRAGRRTEQGNNWLLLQALCRHRHGRIRDRMTARYIRSLSRAWEGPDGLLSDQPRRPRKTRETPLIYHAKMAMCLVRLAAEDVDIGRRANRALKTLARLTRPDGEFGYFGRSENTLFGYACALDAVIRRRRDYRSPPAWLADLEARLLWFVGEQFDPTKLNVQPTTEPAYDPIDGYVKRGVYGAYAAMLFTGLPDREFPARPPREQVVPERGTMSLGATLPFDHCLEGDIDLTISTAGQMKVTHDGADPRYAGGIPVAMTAAGDRIVAGVPSDYRDRPTLPYLPRIDTDSGSFAPVTWTPHEGPADFIGEAKFHEVPVEWGRSIGEAETDRRESSQPSRSRRLLRYLVSRTVIERVVIDRRKQPTPIPAGLTRAIHASDGFVLIQDSLTVSPATASTLTVTPASVTVLEGFAEAVQRATSDEDSPGRSLTDSCSHWGPAVWVTAEQRTVSDSLSIATLIDPLDKVRDLLHPVESASSGTTTRVLTADGEAEFDCPDPDLG